IDSDSATYQLVQLLEREDPFADTDGNITELQLEAVRERLTAQRERIAILDQRARDTGTRSIETLSDLIPLLFAHTTYKSYPESFITNGRWDKLLAWLQTLSSYDLGGVDVSGVASIDEWVEALGRGGFPLLSSSGTSGKPSFL